MESSEAQLFNFEGLGFVLGGEYSAKCRIPSNSIRHFQEPNTLGFYSAFSPKALFFAEGAVSPPKALFLPPKALFFAEGATTKFSDHDVVRFEIDV